MNCIHNIDEDQFCVKCAYDFECNRLKMIEWRKKNSECIFKRISIKK
jgi:hypothetical protein